MAQVQRANVFLTIPDGDIEKYMAKGFSVVDERGNVIRQSVPTELGQLQKAYSEHVALIKDLKSEIQLLKNQLQKQAEGNTSAPLKGVEQDSWSDWAANEGETQPKKRHKTKE